MLLRARGSLYNLDPSCLTYLEHSNKPEGKQSPSARIPREWTKDLVKGLHHLSLLLWNHRNATHYRVLSAYSYNSKGPGSYTG